MLSQCTTGTVTLHDRSLADQESFRIQPMRQREAVPDTTLHAQTLCRRYRTHHVVIILIDITRTGNHIYRIPDKTLRLVQLDFGIAQPSSAGLHPLHVHTQSPETSRLQLCDQTSGYSSHHRYVVDFTASTAVSLEQR